MSALLRLDENIFISVCFLDCNTMMGEHLAEQGETHENWQGFFFPGTWAYYRRACDAKVE